jgi:hypothetical protein
MTDDDSCLSQEDKFPLPIVKHAQHQTYNNRITLKWSKFFKRTNRRKDIIRLKIKLLIRNSNCCKGYLFSMSRLASFKE